jgi:hypothetical protein
MKYAILTPAVRNAILTHKANFTSILNQRKIDYVPIQIKNNLWVLPEPVLDDIRFSELDLRGELTRRNGNQPVDVRDLLPDEVITPSIP